MAETLYSSPRISPKNKFEHFHKIGTEVSLLTFGYIDPWKMKSLPFSPPSAWKADTGGWWQTLTRNFTLKISFFDNSPNYGRANLFTKNSKIILLELISFSEQGVEGFPHSVVVRSQCRHCEGGHLLKLMKLVVVTY